MEEVVAVQQEGKRNMGTNIEVFVNIIKVAAGVLELDGVWWRSAC